VSVGGRFLNITEARIARQPFRDSVAALSLNVDTITTQIMAETDLSMFDQVFLVFVNDGAFPYTVTVTTGEVTGAIDAVAKSTITVPAKVGSNPGQNTLTIGPNNVRSLYRITGVAAGGLTAARFLRKAVPR
jgi:hypothetical protein